MQIIFANEARDIIRQNTPDKISGLFLQRFRWRWEAWVKNKDAWIGIFNPKITKAELKQGYYLVYGFPINSNYVRFGIGQSFHRGAR